MRQTLVLVFAPVLLATAAFAQPSPVARIFDRQLGGVEREVVSLVEAMPAEKFNFAPTNGEFKGVRTFAQQAKHIAAVLYVVSAASVGEKSPSDPGKDENGDPAITSKDQVVQYLKDAFAYSHKTMLALTAENLTQMVKSPFGSGEMARGALAGTATSHTFDHYGQMVVYARMNGIVPPASRR